jgi:hypothetical protein
MTAVNGERSEFAIKDEPIENQRPLRVVVIGAGFSGILAAIRYAGCHDEE